MFAFASRDLPMRAHGGEPPKKAACGIVDVVVRGAVSDRV
jgi:hypothetical protein